MTDLALLQELYREKLTAILQHQAGARVVGQYDANNTYQYIINREEVQLSWIRTAIENLGAAAPDQEAEPEPKLPGTGRGREAAAAVFQADARETAAFVDRWRPRLDQMNDARHRGTLQVILGETLEQKRFFEQALAGETNLLGTRTDEVGPRVGEVLSTRWIE